MGDSICLINATDSDLSLVSASDLVNVTSIASIIKRQADNGTDYNDDNGSKLPHLGRVLETPG